MTATNSVTETTRLATLERYDILDTQPEAVFDDIAKLARDLMGATASMVCFIDKDRQWFKAEAGVSELMGELRETPREISVRLFGQINSLPGFQTKVDIDTKEVEDGMKIIAKAAGIEPDTGVNRYNS